jgi:hypothetical protein
MIENILFSKLDIIDTEIQKYNTNIDIIIKEINKLENINEYIVFNDKKYDISLTHNFIHRSNNCFGKIIKDYYRTCENWNGCYDTLTQYYKN